jgi:hypothetical protein
MNLDPRIILAGQQPDLMAAIDSGNTARARQDQFQHENAFRSMMQEQGPGVLAGDQNALNALARFDPVQALGVQQTQLGMQVTREQLEQVRQATANSLRTAQDQAAARREAQQAQRLIAQAYMAQEMGDDATFRAVAEELGLPQLPMGPQAIAILEAVQKGVLEGQVGGIAAAATQEQRAPISVAAGNTLVDPNTMQTLYRAPAAEGNNQTERDIALLGELGISRDEAIRITQLHTISRDPITGEAVLLDKRTGQPVGGPSQAQQQPAPQQPAAPSQSVTPQTLGFGPDIGPGFQGARQAFGPEGFGRRIANTGAEAIGARVPFPETMQTQQDFAVLGESIVNDFASAYGRQPPSWLLQNIAELAPREGRIFEGPDRARSKLVSISREWQQRLVSAERGLTRRMTPAARQEQEALVSGLRGAIDRVNSALMALESRGGVQVSPEAEEIMRLYE